jgi:CRP-like cAMP-binding protein
MIGRVAVPAKLPHRRGITLGFATFRNLDSAIVAWEPGQRDGTAVADCRGVTRRERDDGVRERVSGNHLLAALPEVERARLARHLARVPLRLKQVLYHPGQTIDLLYFPDTGAVSLVSAMADGRSVEVGIVGSEGVVGVHALYDNARMPWAAVVQLAGEAWALPIRDLRRERRVGGAALPDVLGRYVQTVLIQAMQSAACAGLHSIRQRAARWILSMQDLAKADQFSVTQERVALMLGVRRPTVSVVARSLQRARLIDYRHGKLAVLDRAGLERASCECYVTLREQPFVTSPGSPKRASRFLTDIVPGLLALAS